MRGDKLLVGSNEFRSTTQRGRRDCSRRLIAANCLDGHIGIVGEKCIEVVRKEPRVERKVALACWIAHQHVCEIEANAEPRRDCGCGFVE